MVCGAIQATAYDPSDAIKKAVSLLLMKLTAALGTCHDAVACGWRYVPPAGTRGASHHAYRP